MKEDKREMLLDRYQKDLAESIGENEEHSFVVNHSLYDHVNINDHVVQN